MTFTNRNSLYTVNVKRYLKVTLKPLIKHFPIANCKNQLLLCSLILNAYQYRTLIKYDTRLGESLKTCSVNKRRKPTELNFVCRSV